MLRPALTVRIACERFYLPVNPGLAAGTRRKIRHQINAWEKRTDNPPIQSIGRETFAEFRARSLAHGLKASTIETAISDILLILQHCVDAGALPTIPLIGKRLPRCHCLHPTPSLDEFSKVLRTCNHAVWPRRIKSAPDWWRALLTTIYFCALRRGDLTRLKRCEVHEDRIERVQRKTGIIVSVPLHPALVPLLQRMPKDAEVLFGRAGSLKQIRHQLRTLCRLAGVKPFTLQAVRRLSAQQWDEARGGCGRLILGRRFPGADAFYLSPLKSLTDAMPRLAVPAALGSAKPHRDERRLLIAFRRLDSSTARQAVKLVESLSD